MKFIIAILALFLMMACYVPAPLFPPDEEATDSYRYDHKIISNDLKLSDDEFMVQVMETIKDTGYIRVKFIQENRMGRKYIARAYIFYPKGILKKWQLCFYGGFYPLFEHI